MALEKSFVENFVGVNEALRLRPSERNPSRTSAGTFASGLVPRLMARSGSWRSRASLAKEAIATTLLTVPCSQTNPTVCESPGARGGRDCAVAMGGLMASRNQLPYPRVLTMAVIVV